MQLMHKSIDSREKSGASRLVGEQTRSTIASGLQELSCSPEKILNWFTKYFTIDWLIGIPFYTPASNDGVFHISFQNLPDSCDVQRDSH